MEGIGRFFSMVILLILSLLLSGFVFGKMYIWFIAQPFNLPSIGLTHSVGLITFASLLKHSKSYNESKKEESDINEIIADFIYRSLMLIITLLLGFIVSNLM